MTPAASGTAVAEMRTAQAVVCGSWAFAFEFGWARSIIDRFELVAVPQANPWLVGATNIEGDLLPVIDLTKLVVADAGEFVQRKDHRLLVGGQGAGAIAMVFSRMPQMIRFEPRDGEMLSYAPASIRSVVRGLATNERGESFLEIDGPKLVSLLSELSG
jgi:chemotaxis signal transduction protein